MIKPLSEREKEVAILVAMGLRDVDIANRLFISRRRVGELISSIKQKWNVNSRVEIGIMVYRMGWVPYKNDEMEEDELRFIHGGDKLYFGSLMPYVSPFLTSGNMN